jgi:hypothetical protein
MYKEAKTGRKYSPFLYFIKHPACNRPPIHACIQMDRDMIKQSWHTHFLNHNVHKDLTIIQKSDTLPLGLVSTSKDSTMS